MVLLNLWRQRGVRLKTPQPSVLVLGYYDRCNIGDDAFKEAFRMLLPGMSLAFACIDDVDDETTFDSYSFVIVGGGDIINPYFMERIADPLRRFRGNKYAISVGIPYDDGLKYLPGFDHVIVRSKADVERVSSVIGSRNVTFLPDITCTLHKARALSRGATKIVVCLARPYYPVENVRASALFKQTVSLLRTLLRAYDVTLLPFNSDPDPKNSDAWLNDLIHTEIDSHRFTVVRGGVSVSEMVSIVGSFDLVLGMRFHSIQFAINEGVPFVAIYTTRKIDIMLQDVGCEEFGLKLPVDDSYMPTGLDVEKVTSAIERSFAVNRAVARNVIERNRLAEIIDYGRKTKIPLVRASQESWPAVISRCEDILRSVCKEDPGDWFEGNKTALEYIGDEGRLHLVSRCLAFAVTRKIGSSYEWGLTERLKEDPRFDILAGLKWVHDDMRAKMESAETYLPPLSRFHQRVFVDLEFIAQDSGTKIHRSGWSYVLGGIARMHSGDARSKVDMSVERSFLWGSDVLANAGVIPYKSPWLGFVHHTFDDSYSDYNGKRLFEDSIFKESLRSCIGLISLSEYLATQLKQALRNVSVDVPVIVMTHPTELPSKENLFTMEAFMNNEDRKVVQVGAWLRNSYSIYELRVPRTDLHMSKACLKGAEMDNYFAPDWLFPKLGELLNVSRDTDAHGTICRSHAGNKYVEGMLDMLLRYDSSVRVIDRLDDEEYDRLLSSNVVFMNLVDASAVNAVIECVVRNTPLFVNRHPALEEILGAEYPGFFADMSEAGEKVASRSIVAHCHEYLRSMPKDRLTLEYFVEHFQKVVEILQA